MNYIIIPVRDHFEIHQANTGEFVCSADNKQEAGEEINRMQNFNHVSKMRVDSDRDV